LLNRRTSAQYRQRVLEPGGSKPAATLVQDFLGRVYEFDAFEAWLNRG
jgi:thimet oligopeptidase